MLSKPKPQIKGKNNNKKHTPTCKERVREERMELESARCLPPPSLAHDTCHRVSSAWSMRNKWALSSKPSVSPAPTCRHRWASTRRLRKSRRRNEAELMGSQGGHTHLARLFCAAGCMCGALLQFSTTGKLTVGLLEGLG